VRELLKQGRPVWLISTQVVECGVDLDFPVVYRALAPLDRIVQAAGRCNRNGDSPDGRVIVFTPIDGGSPRGSYLTGGEQARLMMLDRDAEDLHLPELYEEYFDRLFRSVPSRDRNDVAATRETLNFPETASHSVSNGNGGWMIGSTTRARGRGNGCSPSSSVSSRGTPSDSARV
jgi:CRISPR-associated endonuclease/helicase Cas3